MSNRCDLDQQDWLSILHRFVLRNSRLHRFALRNSCLHRLVLPNSLASPNCIIKCLAHVVSIYILSCSRPTERFSYRETPILLLLLFRFHSPSHLRCDLPWKSLFFLSNMHSSMKSKGRSRDESNILASRDKHSVVRSFQASLKEDLKLSQQRSSKHKVHKFEGDVVQIKSKALGVPFDADKLAKDAGGRYLYCSHTIGIHALQHFSWVWHSLSKRKSIT